MNRWECPHCGETVECIGSEVGHQCRKNRNRFTRFTRVYQEDQ